MREDPNRKGVALVSRGFPVWLLSAGLVVTSLVQAVAVRANETKSYVDHLLTSYANKEFLNSRLLSVLDYQTNESRSGLFLTTDVVPGTGRLLISRSSSTSLDSCSGIVVDRQHFLTAAHCLCKTKSGDAKTSTDCESELTDLKLQIFLPQHGLFDVTAPPIIHPDYRSPSYIQPSALGDIGNSGQARADLALIRFEGVVESNIPSLGPGVGSYLVATYGKLYFTIQDYAKAIGFEIGQPIAPGVGQVSRIREVFKTRADCRRYHSADTFCSLYNPIEVEDGPLQMTTVCQGDSGAPIFQRNTLGNWSVVGLVSYFSPPNQFDGCSGDTGRRTHFTSLSAHLDWLSSHVNMNREPTKVRSCVDGVFHSGSIDFIAFTGTVTLSGFNKKTAQDAAIISNSVSSPQQCETNEFFKVISCHLAKPSYLSLEIKSDFAQVTICESNSDAKS